MTAATSRLPLSALPLDRTVTVETPDGRFLVTRTATGVTALSATCTHAAGPVAVTADGCASCPWHGAEFDPTTGTVRRGPARRPLRPAHVRVVDGAVELHPSPTLTGDHHAVATR